jgi:hypothetical protein
MKDSHCIFCQKPLNASTRAKEHVLPLWLLREFDLENEAYEGLHTGHEWGKEVKSFRSHNLGSLICGDVCMHCNGGWMSEIETQTSALLTHLIKTDSGFVSLTRDSQRTLSRWIFKTVIVLNAASNYRPLIPSDHVINFYKNRHLPKALTIELMFGLFQKGVQSWQGQNMTFLFREKTSLPQDLMRSQYVVALNICGLHIRTSWTRFDRSIMDIRLEADVHRIWPPQKQSLVLNAGKRATPPRLFQVPSFIQHKSFNTQ